MQLAKQSLFEKSVAQLTTNIKALTQAHSLVSGVQAKVAAYGRPLLRKRNFFGAA
jgi:hypothetical protein